MSSSTVILIASILVGSLFGHVMPTAGKWLSGLVDYTLIALISLLLFSVRFSDFFRAAKNLRFLLITLIANFVFIPLIGYGIASLFLSAYPLFMVGLVIYFMSPCTDWFLSFTRLSEGNVALGAALIPINMTVQLLLYPFFLQWFTQNSAPVEATTIGYTLLQWFMLPLLFAFIAHKTFYLLLNRTRVSVVGVIQKADGLTSWITALLVLQIFAGNISVIIENFDILGWALLALFSFFFITFLLSQILSHYFRLKYPERALLTMTIAARNAPLMLAATMAAIPNQPLIYTAIIIGMLVEFPHLITLQRLLLSSRQQLREISTSQIKQA